MAFFSIRTFAFLFSAVAAAALMTSAAEAGFEWRGPLAPPPAATVPAAPAPAATPQGALGGLEPVIMWNGEADAAMPAVKTEDVEKQPVGAAVPAADVIDGFGADLPLVIALQQVTPAGYRVSFAPGVDPGGPVSWSGGKPWRQVLSDMLATRGLSASVQDNTVVVSRGAAMPAAPSAPVSVMSERPTLDDFPVALAAPKTAAPSSPASTPQPDETAFDRVLLGRASQAGVTVAASPAVAPTDIRRDKPSSLLEKMGIRPFTAAAAPVEPVVRQSPSVVDAPVPLKPVAATDLEPVKLQSVKEAPVVVEAQKPAAIEPAWRGAKGQTLRALLKEWSDVAGVDLYWSIDYDYRLDADVSFSGSYDTAVGNVLDKFRTARPQPYGQLHQSGDGPRVLVIKSYDLAR